MNNCLFCQIVAGKIPSYQIYEDSQHLGFLDIYPATKGQTLVIPKKHYSSYVFDMPLEDYTDLIITARTVARYVDRALGSIRTCMVMEGMEVDHAHIKLYPIHTILNKTSTETIDLNKYPGYLSTLHGKRMPDNELELIAQRIKLTIDENDIV